MTELYPKVGMSLTLESALPAVLAFARCWVLDVLHVGPLLSALADMSCCHQPNEDGLLVEAVGLPTHSSASFSPLPRSSRFRRREAPERPSRGRRITGAKSTTTQSSVCMGICFGAWGTIRAVASSGEG